MDTPFKRLMSFALAALIFAACSSDSSPVGPDEPEEEPEEIEVGIESFGFYQEDNPEVLFDDYVTENISGTEITVNLPEEANITNLIARFTTTNNDTVTVQDVEQESGVTANDFSNPLEYLVTEKDENSIYTVTVGKLASAVWNEMMAFSADSVRDISLGVNPVTSLPAVAFVSDREEFENRKLNMISYEDGSWSLMGGADFSPDRARNPKLAFDSEGVPYISFGDNSTDPTQASVMSYSNSSWSYLGGAPHSGIEADDVNAIAIGDDDSVYGFYRDGDRGAKASVFNGGWSDLPVTGREGNSMAMVAAEGNGDIYLGILNFGSVSVHKYSDGAWSVLADHMTDNEDSMVYWYTIAMDVDEEGNVYLAYAEDVGNDYQLRVNKFSAENESWSTVGELITTSEVRSFDVAVDVYGKPIFLYKDDVGSPTAVVLDEETNNWASPVTLDGVDGEDLNIAVAPNGVAYASYTVDNRIRVQMYASPDGQ